MEAKVYNQQGKEAGNINLPESVFGVSWNADLVHDVTTSILSSKRTPVAHTKDRGDVRGGGKKPWRQKGTGRARHGSTRSPIWVGGGVAHGPRNEKDYTRKVNKKAKLKALATIISAKFKEGEILFVDKVIFSEPKAKDAKNTLSFLGKIAGFEKIISKRKNTALISLASKDRNVEKSFANFGNIEVSQTQNINPVDILKYKYLIIENPEVSVASLKDRIEQ